MTDKARIIHQILNKIVLHKLGSKDSVFANYEFLLINILSGRKVNLPAVLFEIFKKYTSKPKKLTGIPYGSLLQRIIQGIPDLVDAATGDVKKRLLDRVKQPELGNINFLRMNLPTIQRAMKELVECQKNVAGLTKEDAKKRVKETRQEMRRQGTSSELPKKDTPKKKVKKLVIQESDDETEKIPLKKTKNVHKSESTRKRTRFESMRLKIDQQTQDLVEQEAK